METVDLFAPYVQDRETVIYPGRLSPPVQAQLMVRMRE